MKKIVLTYGLIAGAIVATMMFITIPFWKSGVVNFKNGEVVGYTTMVVALSVIFFGVKSYRDKQADGAITFWQGVKIGGLITLIAGVMYALAWEVSFPLMGDDFLSKMTETYLNNMKADGATAAELQKSQEQFASYQELYKNPLVRFPMSMMEILPVGIAITLISAALLRKKGFLPATEPAS